MSVATPTTDQNASPTQAPFSIQTRKASEYSRRPYDTLGIVWVHGLFHAGVFRREVFKWGWACPGVVHTPEEFESALDQAMVELRFGGTEVFLILEHDVFVHQVEQAPAFSDAAAKVFLRGRVERFEKEHEPVLWVSQRTVSARKEATFLLHLLPSAFYGRINGLLLDRHLDLTRILPLTVPLQLSIPALAAGKPNPIMIAADSGHATTVMVGQPDGELLFARTMMMRWDTDPARIAVEVNRSVLYAKQQFSAVIETIWLLGTAGETARTEVQTRCGAGKEIILRHSTTLDWMALVAKLTPRHPVNLVAGYLGRKRRLQFVRRVLISACWIALTLLGVDAWARVQSRQNELRRLHDLQKNHSALIAERDALIVRNKTAQQLRDFVRQASDERLLPIPSRFLAHVSGILPQEAQLTELSIRWDDATGKWVFRMQGVITGDEESCQESLAAFRRNLSRSLLQIKMSGPQSMMPLPSSGLGSPAGQRFTLEGTLFEN